MSEYVGYVGLGFLACLMFVVIMVVSASCWDSGGDTDNPPVPEETGQEVVAQPSEPS